MPGGVKIGTRGGRNKDIKKSRLRWSGQMMQMREERVTKKILHTKIEENDQEPDG